MPTAIIYIIWAMATAGWGSALYFLLLAAGIPGIGIAVAIVLLLMGGLYYLQKKILPIVSFVISPLSTLTMVGVGVISWVMVVSSASHITSYGGWDAWAIWNLQAKYLADGTHWQNMFLNTRHGHPDYPLLVPTISAICSRLVPSAGVEVPAFFWSVAMAILVLVLLWLSLRPKSLLVSAWAVYSVVASQYYVTQATAMYADITLACFFLAAIQSLRLLPAGNLQVLLSALCIGCCVWTKNEGTILAGLFTVFHCRTLLLQKRWVMFLSGISLPLTAWCLLKGVYAPANDLAHNFSVASLQQLMQWARYGIIWQHMADTVNAHFGYMRWVIVLYLLVCLFRKRWPTATAWMLAGCMAAYFFIYVLSPMDLNWHLVTSADRLMLQLMPALLYVLIDDGIGNKIAMPQNIFFSRFGMNG